MSALSIFKRAHERTHQINFRELQNGYKSSQWSWWKCPQVAGLGTTSPYREYTARDCELG